ncbi:hypothetical protein R1flu_006459 [Riccia fluitans]|uniref:RRM domain-containing protein n=1 Tax=Riccia fluitans TaxID=41844 RepID=A0ABD1YWF0_9MARC
MASRLGQTCLRRLGGKLRHDVSRLLIERSSSEAEGIFARSCCELAGRTRAIRSESWTQNRWYNVADGGESSGGRNLTGERRVRKILGARNCSPFTRWRSAMLNTSNPFEQNASEETPSQQRDVESLEDQEFVPENVVTPKTPLVQAIEHADERSVDAHGQVVSPSSSAGDLGEIPPSEREIDPLRVYVGGLPFDHKGDQLKQALSELFGKYGIVKEVELSRHRHQSFKSTEEGKHRGYAFVTMDAPEQASAAIDELNGETFLGRTMTVSTSLKPVEVVRRRTSNEERVARRKVFVGNLHEDTTLETLSNTFEQYGTVISAKLITQLNTGKSRGFGFVTFETEAEAMKAILDLDGSILDGSVIRVNIAKYPQSL